MLFDHTTAFLVPAIFLCALLVLLILALAAASKQQQGLFAGEWLECVRL
jgi:hypothetical protein